MVAHAASTPEVTFDILINDEVRNCPLQTNREYAIRALIQLLDNAFKFTKQGRVTLSAEKDDHWVSFVVEDTGIGIPQEELSHVFEEFVQLDDYNDGMGIGLTMARSIAIRLGGSLEIDANYTNGASFILKLPQNVVQDTKK